MPADNESVVRAAYAAYARGDVAGVLEFVDPDLEWTCLNPMEEIPRRRPATGAVLTVRDGRITALRACRDHDEARDVAGVG